MADETIRLILQTKGQETIDGLRKSTENYQALVKQLVEDYARGEITTEELTKAQSRYSAELDRETKLLNQLLAAQAEEARQAKELADATARATVQLDAFDEAIEAVIADASRAATATDRMGSSIKKGAKETKESGADIGRTALEASRAIEDFQYGIGGVVNNIPGLVQALGGGAGAMAAFSLGAVAIAQVVKHWDELTALFQERVAIPKTTDDIKGLTDWLDKARERMEELGAKTSVTTDELDEYEKLVGQVTDAEAKLDQQRQTEANRKAHGIHSNDMDRQAAAGFGKALDQAGGYEKVIERFVREQMARTGETNEALVKSGLEEAFNRALSGDRGTIATIRNIAGRDQTGVTGMFDTLINNNDPVVKQQREAEAKRAEEEKKKAEKDQQDATRKADKEKRDREREEEQAAASDARESAKADKEEEARLSAEARARQKQIGQQVSDEDAGLDRGGYIDQAQRRIAEITAQGGETDRFGRFQSMSDPGQIRLFVEREIRQALQSRNRGRLSPGQADDLAARATALGSDRLTDDFTRLNSSQLDNTEKLLLIVEQLQAKVSQQGQRINRAARGGQAQSRTAFPTSGG